MIRTLALFYLPAAVRGYATSLNKIILIGNVGQHPEFRVLKEGNSAATSANGPRGVWSFSVATERRYKRAGSNEWQSSTEWHRVNQYGTQAKPQFADRWIQKGTKVQIEGRVSYYKNKKGRMYASIIADSICALNFKPPFTNEEIDDPDSQIDTNSIPTAFTSRKPGHAKIPTAHSRQKTRAGPPGTFDQYPTVYQEPDTSTPANANDGGLTTVYQGLAMSSGREDGILADKNPIN